MFVQHFRVWYIGHYIHMFDINNTCNYINSNKNRHLPFNNFFVIKKIYNIRCLCIILIGGIFLLWKNRVRVGAVDSFDWFGHDSLGRVNGLVHRFCGITVTGKLLYSPLRVKKDTWHTSWDGNVNEKALAP